MPSASAKGDLACPCCRNPWSRPDEFEFAMACGECIEQSSGVTGIDPANMDLSISPAADFYRHASGRWIKSNPIPGDYPAWNTFTALHDANLSRLKALLEGLTSPSSGAPETVEHKVAAFWKSAQDEAAIEAAGLAPLEPVLAACDLAATDKTAAIAKLHAEYGVNAFFQLGEGPDDKDSGWTLHQVQQGGLGLPDRDYYFDEDKAELRKLYLAHVSQMLSLLGETAEAADESAQAVLRIETALAASHLTRTERRDPDTVYNKMSVPKVAALCKGAIDWPRYFELAAFKVPKALNVDTPVALATASRLLETSAPSDLRAYLRWHAAHACAAHLPAAFVDAHFAFFSKALSGQQEQKPRWKRAMAMVDGALGDAVGQLYVERYFAPQAKARALHIVGKVRAALEARLREVAWMQESTRAKALEKMNGFGVKVGFPDEWVDYSSLTVVMGDHLGNVLRSQAFEHRRQMAYADARTDKRRWMMHPQQINAYYHPNLNEIVFPAVRRSAASASAPCAVPLFAPDRPRPRPPPASCFDSLRRQFCSRLSSTPPRMTQSTMAASAQVTPMHALAASPLFLHGVPSSSCSNFTTCRLPPSPPALAPQWLATR